MHPGKRNSCTWRTGMNSPKKTIDEVTEEYNKLHGLPVDVTKQTGHEQFVEGLRNGTLGFKVIRGEPITLVKGGRKIVFNALVVLYLIAPLLTIPFWAYHRGNWWLLAGIPVASLISPQLAQIKGHLPGVCFLIATVGLWFSRGFRDPWTFLSVCALWGYALFQMAENAQTGYAIQCLIEDPALFDRAILEERILIVRPRK